MAVKITGDSFNLFPHVETVDANPVKDGYELILMTRIEGQVVPVLVKLTDAQAGNLSKLLGRGR